MSVNYNDVISGTLDSIKTKLIEKNELYRNSSFNEPILFGGATRRSQIEARIEDKFHRLSNINYEEKPISYYDTVFDLIGYLTLYLIVLREDMDADSRGDNY